MAREHLVLSALGRAGALVPRTLAYCDDPIVCESPFFLMEHVEGLVGSSAAAEVALVPAARAAAAQRMAENLANLHALKVEAIGLGELRRPEPLASRQLRRWVKQWHASKTRDLPLVDELARIFEADLPEERDASLIHGDYHLGNLLVGEDGSIRAVVDWELCTVGDPLADVGQMIAYWTEMGTSDTDSLFPEPVTSLPGYPDARSLAAAYLGASGRDASALGFWVAFSYWKVAIIVEGVYRRWLNDPSNGTNAGRLATTTVRLVELAAAATDSSGAWNGTRSLRSRR